MFRSMVWLTFAALALSAPAARAASECKELKAFEHDEGAGRRKYVDVFNFRRDRRGDNVLLLFKDTIEKGQPPKQWLFLHRPSPDQASFCVAGRGEGVGDDIVLYTEGLSGPGFQFAIGPDHDWIIIQDNVADPQTSCVFDSGTDVLMRFNLTIPAD